MKALTKLGSFSARSLVSSLVLTGALLAVPAVFATTLNYDPTAPAPAPVLGAGWISDEVDAVNTDSLDSPYNIVVPDGQHWKLSVTDYFNTGDTYFVYDFGNLILTTQLLGALPPLFPIGDSDGNLGWTNADYSKGTVALQAGAHLITIQGDGVGGVPAGFYTRLDVPEPATLTLLATGLLGMGLSRRRQVK